MSRIRAEWRFPIWFASILLLLLGACLIGPNRPCDADHPCSDGYACIKGWCANSKTQKAIESLGDGGGTE